MPDGQVPNSGMLLYERRGDMLRYNTTGMTNHELRELMVGIWSRLSAADRADHIKELQHYQEDGGATLSQVASAINQGTDNPNAINLGDVRNVFYAETRNT
jgi:hypothetical protein